MALALIKHQSNWIIAGGGTAGVALPTRLSQGLPNSKILLTEAGPLAFGELGINALGKKGSTLEQSTTGTSRQSRKRSRIEPWYKTEGNF